MYLRVLTDEQASEMGGDGHPRGLARQGLPPGEGYEIFLYVNEAESPGSISYLVHRFAIRVIAAASVGRAAPQQ